MSAKGFTAYVDSNNNNVLDTGEPSYFAQDSGGFRIPGLSAGTHTLRVVAPPGWQLTNPAGGEYVINVSSTPTTYNNYNFLFATNAVVSGRLFEDTDNDAVLDPQERTFAGQRVYVDLDNGGTYQSTTEPSVLSGADGTYSIAGLTPGNQYVIRVAPPARPAAR